MSHAEATAQANLVAIPIDVAQNAPCRAYVGRFEGGWRVRFGQEGGRRSEWAGPTFPAGKRGQRQARALAQELNARGADA